jgi:hypothetical protein
VYTRLDYTETDIKALVLYAHIWYRDAARSWLQFGVAVIQAR